MITSWLARPAFVALAAFAVLSVYGCGGATSRPDNTPSPAGTMVSSTLSDIDTFAKNPNETTEEALHVDSIGPVFSADAISRLVKLIAHKDVPRRVLDELAMDMANNDFGATAKWLRMTNVSSRLDSSDEGRRAVKRTALFAWTLMALRAGFDTNYVDLGGMDLRLREPFVGQSMNLFNVSFIAATLPGGEWRSSNLGATKFDQATTDGPLRCVNCTWGSLRTVGTTQLTNGRWNLLSQQ